jgi:uncharacterized protein (TIGR03118 family)
LKKYTDKKKEDGIACTVFNKTGCWQMFILFTNYLIKKILVMKNLISTTALYFMGGALGIVAIAGFNSCNNKESDPLPPTPANQQSFNQVNLVASDAAFNATRVDPHLINGWGIAFSATGVAWISTPGDHSTVIYKSTGEQQLAPVTIPTHGATTGGNATGQVINASAGFKLLNNNPARFIFAGTDGVISGWNGGAAAVGMVDRNATSVYTGLAIGAVGTDSFLYAADFKSGKIDVFDKTWTLQASTFTDPGLPAGYSPFNVQNIGNQLYVTYAQVDPATHEEKKGAGLGVVNIFNTNGNFVKRLVTGAALNAPWGVAQAPVGWMTAIPTATVILVGNFGDGHINAYDATSGNWYGTLEHNGSVITIDGLWAISFVPATATTVSADWLYFAAGPGGETKGLFGYVTK